LDDVTSPIHISIGSSSRRNLPSDQEAKQTQPAESPRLPAPPKLSSEPAVVRNILFSNIHGTVTTNPRELPDVSFPSDYRRGEGHSCITLNSVGNSILENISFDNVHLTFGGGGTAGEAARRDLPQIAGEYFMLGHADLRPNMRGTLAGSRCKTCAFR
jgi:hypothetical protein